MADNDQEEETPARPPSLPSAQERQKTELHQAKDLKRQAAEAAEAVSAMFKKQGHTTRILPSLRINPAGQVDAVAQETTGGVQAVPAPARLKNAPSISELGKQLLELQKQHPSTVGEKRHQAQRVADSLQQLFEAFNCWDASEEAIIRAAFRWLIQHCIPQDHTKADSAEMTSQDNLILSTPALRAAVIKHKKSINAVKEFASSMGIPTEPYVPISNILDGIDNFQENLITYHEELSLSLRYALDILLARVDNEIITFRETLADAFLDPEQPAPAPDVEEELTPPGAGPSNRPQPAAAPLYTETATAPLLGNPGDALPSAWLRAAIHTDAIVQTAAGDSPSPPPPDPPSIPELRQALCDLQRQLEKQHEPTPEKEGEQAQALTGNKRNQAQRVADSLQQLFEAFTSWAPSCEPVIRLAFRWLIAYCLGQAQTEADASEAANQASNILNTVVIQREVSELRGAIESIKSLASLKVPGTQGHDCIANILASLDTFQESLITYHRKLCTSMRYALSLLVIRVGQEINSFQAAIERSMDDTYPDPEPATAPPSPAADKAAGTPATVDQTTSTAGQALLARLNEEIMAQIHVDDLVKQMELECLKALVTRYPPWDGLQSPERRQCFENLIVMLVATDFITAPTQITTTTVTEQDLKTALSAILWEIITAQSVLDTVSAAGLKHYHLDKIISCIQQFETLHGLLQSTKAIKKPPVRALLKNLLDDLHGCLRVATQACQRERL